MAADILKLLAHLLIDIDQHTPGSAAEMIRQWFSARRAELHRRPNRPALVEADIRIMDRWIKQQFLHPDERVRQFWATVRHELLFPRREGGAR